jgi:apolipoprotein N-acyltransferase
LLGQALASVEPGESAGRLVQIADIFGVYGVSFVPAMVSGLLGDLLTRPLMQREGRGLRRIRRSIRWSVGLCALVLVASWAYGQWRITQYHQLSGIQAPGPRIAVVQTNIAQSNKNRPTRETDQKIWDQLLALSKRAVDQKPKPDLIVWPETIVPAALNQAATQRYALRARQWADRSADSMRQSRHAEAFQRMARRYDVSLAELGAYRAAWLKQKGSYRSRVLRFAGQSGVPLLVGASFERRSSGPGNDPIKHNSVYFVKPGASPDAPLPRYDKLHLVPFGEYVPWVEALGLKGWFLRVLTPYDHDYTLDRGGGPVVFDLTLTRDGGATGAGAGKDGGSAGAVESQPRRSTDRPLNGAGGLAAQDGGRVGSAGSVAQRVGLVTPICFEDADGALCSRMVHGPTSGKRAQVLVNLTNDGWFAGSDQPWQHLQLATLRSIENRVPTARSVNTGVSGFVDSLGRVRRLVKTDGRSQDVKGLATHAVTLDTRRTWHATLGAWPAVGLALITGVLCLGGLALPDRGRN